MTKILPLDSGTQNWNESWHGTRPPGRVTVMAGVQAVAALVGDEHGHYEDDDFSSLNDSAITDATAATLLLSDSDEHHQLEREYEADIERDVHAARGTLSEGARADPTRPSSASMTDVLTSGGVQDPQHQAFFFGKQFH